jgi:hypothetical protein
MARDSFTAPPGRNFAGERGAVTFAPEYFSLKIRAAFPGIR